MFKGLLTIGLFLVGGTGFAWVAYLGSHPLALTRPAEPSLIAPETRDVERAAAAMAPFVVPEDLPVAAPDPTRVAEQTRVSAHLVRKVAPPTTVEDPVPGPAEPGDLRPCGDWRQIGTQYVTDGQGIGAHNVRQLCE